MKKIIPFFKLIATGSLSLILTACYGVAIKVMYGIPYNLNNRRVCVKNTEGTPIPGLRLSVIEDDLRVKSVKYTDTMGEAEISTDEMNTGFDYDIYLDDMDGSGNLGHYESEFIPIDLYSDITTVHVEVDKLVLNGSFRIIDADNRLPGDLDISVTMENSDTGIDTEIIPVDNIYSYQFTPETRTSVNLKINSGDYQLQSPGRDEAAFRLIEGDFSIVLQDAGAVPGTISKISNIEIVDALGRNLFTESSQIEIVDAVLNTEDILQEITTNMGNENLAIPIDPSEPNLLELSWKDVYGSLHVDSFDLFAGIQKITLR